VNKKQPRTGAGERAPTAAAARWKTHPSLFSFFDWRVSRAMEVLLYVFQFE